MAKESMKAREVKRAKLVAKYAEKRKALKEAGVRRDICVCSESAVSSSARWQATDLSRA